VSPLASDDAHGALTLARQSADSPGVTGASASEVPVIPTQSAGHDAVSQSVARAATDAPQARGATTTGPAVVMRTAEISSATPATVGNATPLRRARATPDSTSAGAGSAHVTSILSLSHRALPLHASEAPLELAGAGDATGSSAAHESLILPNPNTEPRVQVNGNRDGMPGPDTAQAPLVIARARGTTSSTGDVVQRALASPLPPARAAEGTVHATGDSGRYDAWSVQARPSSASGAIARAAEIPAVAAPAAMAMVWRRPDDARAVPGRDAVVMRAMADGSNAGVSSLSGATGLDALAAAPPAAPMPDLNRLADQVTRMIVRRLEVERERRGGTRWP
jgi:hypothetical protein